MPLRPPLRSWASGPARLRRRTVAIPGFQIAYLDGGRGEPLVLLHGIGGDKDNWTFVSLFLVGQERHIWEKTADLRAQFSNQGRRLSFQ